MIAKTIWPIETAGPQIAIALPFNLPLCLFITIRAATHNITLAIQKNKGAIIMLEKRIILAKSWLNHCTADWDKSSIK